MSGSVGKMANPLGPGVPVPGGGSADMPPPRASGGAGAALGAGGPLGAGSPMGPPGGPSGAAMGMMPNGLDAATKAISQQHGQAKAAYQQTSKAIGQLDHMRKGLERLTDMGDMVRPEDIIAEASKLVAHGIDPMALAGILADMPQQGGGEALGGWVMSHAIAAAQAEQQLLVAKNVAAHEMGVAAIHALTAHDVGAAVTGPPPHESMDGGNALSPEGQMAPASPAMAGGEAGPSMGGSLGLGASGPRGG